MNTQETRYILNNWCRQKKGQKYGAGRNLKSDRAGGDAHQATFNYSSAVLAKQGGPH